MLRAALLSILLCAMGCASADPALPAPVTGEDALTTVKIGVEASGSLPLEEISGLGVRTIGDRPSYLAVSDSSTTLITFSLGGDGSPRNVEEHDLARLFGGGDSQWEAVAGDAAGRTFIMSEADATVSVLTPDFELAHIFRLRLPEESPLYHSWDRDPNSRGEGMVLLANGHILVAKEKGPAALVEFAPAGEAAAGYLPELALRDRPFTLPTGARSELVAVASWELKASAARLIGDISDLAVGADGALLVLSDQSRAIARVERELTVDEGKIDLKALWNLPGEIDKPEGLLVVDGKPAVACDLARAEATSFFALSPL